MNRIGVTTQKASDTISRKGLPRRMAPSEAILPHHFLAKVEPRLRFGLRSGERSLPGKDKLGSHTVRSDTRRFFMVHFLSFGMLWEAKEGSRSA